MVVSIVEECPSDAKLTVSLRRRLPAFKRLMSFVFWYVSVCNDATFALL
jgi:hypothetical protein